jgi:hypothetical protein
MAYFAEINSSNIVLRVVAASSEDVETHGGKGSLESEEFFKTVCPLSEQGVRWVQTSYQTLGGIHYDINATTGSMTVSVDQSKAYRKNFAGIGSSYDSVRDAFIVPQPYPSWTLNDFTCRWDPPTIYPSITTYGAGIPYDVITWDQGNQRWLARTGNPDGSVNYFVWVPPSSWVSTVL